MESDLFRFFASFLDYFLISNKPSYHFTGQGRSLKRSSVMKRGKVKKKARIHLITKMQSACSELTLVVSLLVGGVCCPALCTVMEGENVTIDCGFQTTVNGGNLLWTSAISTNGSETDLGHIVPGDHFCGTDAVACTVHTNGSITLINVTVYDGDKRYRCLRGDKEGYQYFSDVHLTVLAKESLGHPVIQPPTESKANAFIGKEKGVILAYEQPTCEDKEDGSLIVTCYPPSGLIMDKVYDQVHCDCTDSDGNSNSLNITVNSHAELEENTTSIAVIVVCIILCVTIVALVCIVVWCICQLHKAKNARNPENFDVCCSPRLGEGTTGGSNHSLHQHDEEGLKLNLDGDDVSQRLKDKEAECRDKSDEIAKLKEENQNKDTEISDLRRRLTEKEIEWTDKFKEVDKPKMEQQKVQDTEISDLRRRLTEKEIECAVKSKGFNEMEEMNRHKDAIIFYLIDKLTEIDNSLYLHHKMSHLNIPCTGISAYSHHRDRYFCKVGASRNCKESDLDELLSKHFRYLLRCRAFEDHHMKVGENPESSDKITFKRGEVELSHPSV